MNDMSNAVTTTQPRDAITQFKSQLSNSEMEFKAALPAHIPLERFTRVVTTAVVSNPDLLGADRRSLFEAAVKAAQDGLLPDGRDGALVIYGKRVQWMPMIGGILKKVRNSGDLKSIRAHIAYEHDKFEYQLGDEEKIVHVPELGDRGKPRLAYAIAETKDGGIYREIMTVGEIEQVRAVSRAGNAGPWVQWWAEMARKTVLRRLSKRLPMSSDLDDLIRRDDALYDFDGARGGERPAIDPPRGLTGKLEALANTGRIVDATPQPVQSQEQPPHDPENGEVVQKPVQTEDRSAGPETAGSIDNPPPAPPPAEDDGFPGDAPMTGSAPKADPVQAAYKAGQDAKANKVLRRAIPPGLRAEGREAEMDAWLAGHDGKPFPMGDAP